MSDVDEQTDDGPIDVDDADLVAPPVVAVVVTHDPGPWFDETLAGLRDQDYPALSVLVIDAGSTEDPTGRVAEVLPDAYVRRLEGNPGFGPAANEVLAVVEGAAFHLFCHDDVALAPDAVRALVQEAYRSNAGIVGPKLVQWDDPARLLQVGLLVDKSGHEVHTVERGELDQEQHDAVRDVFCVPGGATLVRADLFTTLGGFDPVVTFLGEDLDLCWRAQVAGARVLVAPAAVARHLEALPRREGFDYETRRRYVLRHRLRVVLVAYSRFHRFRVVPQLALLNLAEVVYSSLAGRRDLARAIVDSWRWNRSQKASIAAARARLAAIRTVPDSEVRRLQARGSARFALFLRGQVGAGGDDRVKALTRSAGDLAGTLRRGPARTSMAVWAALVVVLLFGSRHFLTGQPPSLVDLPQLPTRPWPLLAEWLSGWRRAGLGAEAPQPTAFGLLGVAGTGLLGSMAMLRRLLVLVPLLVGPIGASRLVRATGSRRASWVAAVTYAAIPLPYDALAAGRWGGLVAWSVTPWVLGGLVRDSGDEPFRPGPRAGRPWWAAALGVGLVTAVLAAVVPVAVLLPFALALVLVLGGALAGRAAGAGRLLGTGLGATVVAAALHLPWALEPFLPGAAWASVAGAASATAAPGLGELLRFELGPIGAAPLGWVFLVAAALPVVIGRSWRLRWAVRSWVLAAAGWGAAIVAGADGLDLSLGPPELLLAPAAAGLTVATALGMVAFEVDLPGYRFGWRQVASFTAAAAVVLGAVPVVGGAFDGAWSAPREGVTGILGFLDDQQQDGAFRTLWIGDPAVLPLGGWQLDDGVAWALTDRGIPNVVDRWPGSPDGTTALVADALHLADGRETARLGRLLAPMGIRYVVVVEADRPVVGPQAPAPRALVDALGEQLDLAEISIDEGLRVFRNAAWFPARAVLEDPDDADAPDGALAAAARADRSGAAPALPEIEAVDAYRGPLEEGDVLWHAAAAADGWRLEVDGTTAERAEGFGFGTTYTAPTDGAAELRYTTPVYRLLLCGLQAAAWVLVLRAVLRNRRRGPAGAAP